MNKKSIDICKGKRVKPLIYTIIIVVILIGGIIKLLENKEVKIIASKNDINSESNIDNKESDSSTNNKNNVLDKDSNKQEDDNNDTTNKNNKDNEEYKEENKDSIEIESPNSTSTNLDSELSNVFEYTAIPENIKNIMLGKSLPKNVNITFEDLSYLKVAYYGFDKQSHIGELVVRADIAKEVVDIFQELYEKKYPIEKIKLIDEYDANDNLSMADNNTSGFCYRNVPGTNYLSNHSKGLAIDINPVQNPYVDGESITPEESKNYMDRDNVRKGMVIEGDPCYEAFIKRGWIWGGHWSDPDYQHFEKKL